MLQSPQYRLFATRGKHDFQFFSAMRRVYLQSKETKSIVMAYVEIRQPRNRKVGDDCPGMERRCIPLRNEDQHAIRDQKGTGRRKLSLEGGVNGRPLDSG